jgi:Integrase core domain.
MDFMQDALCSGRIFRTFNVLDESNREASAIEIGATVPSARVIRGVERLIDHGKPGDLRIDNGPEFASVTFEHWCLQRGMSECKSRPASRIRTRSLSASTERIAARYSMRICSNQLSTCSC